MDGGKIRDANALRKIALNSASRPPIPRSSNLKSARISALACVLSNVSIIWCLVLNLIWNPYARLAPLSRMVDSLDFVNSMAV